MNSRARLLAHGLLVFTVWGCTGRTEQVCRPGESVACSCGAQMGAQSCQDDGAAFGSCQCNTSGSSSGGSGGSGVSSGGLSSGGGSSGRSSSSGASSSGSMGSSSVVNVAVSILAPLEGAPLAGDATITLMVTGAPTSVTLLVDGAVNATVTTPYTHVLNTRTFVDGAHTLQARAVGGGRTVDSTLINVTVDNAAPSVSNVTFLDRVDAPVTVTFSEPIRAGTLTGMSLRLLVDQRPVTAALTQPSPQVLVLTPTVYPILPGQAQLVATLATIQDLAGNPLTGATVLATKQLAVWAPDSVDRSAMPAGGLGGTVAVLPNQTVVTAEIESQPSTQVTLRALAPNSTTFTPLPGSAASATADLWRVSVAAAPDNTLWLAILKEGPSNNRGVLLVHQVGTGWVEQAFINTPDSYATWPTLAVASDGAVLVGFVETAPSVDTVRVLHRAPTGMLFGDLLEWPLTNRLAGGFAMALDSAGNPAVAVTTNDVALNATVVETNVYDGANWATPPALTNIQPISGEVSLAHSPATGFALAHTEQDFAIGGNTSLYVDQLVNNAWIPFGPPLDVDVRNSAAYPRLVGGPDLTVAWVEFRLDPGPGSGLGRLLMARHDGTAWRGMAQARDVLPPGAGGFLGYPARDARGFVWTPMVLVQDMMLNLPFRTTTQRTNVPGPQQGLPAAATATPCVIPVDPPATLSATNCFTNLTTMEPAAGVIPYSINSTLWSDAAEKNRWMVIPPGTTITFNATGALTLPEGTILIKDFFIPIDPVNNPAAGRLAETRFLVLRPGNLWDGYSYQWRDDTSDADLLPDAPSTKDFTRVDNSIHTHTYPSRVQCGRWRDLGPPGPAAGQEPHLCRTDRQPAQDPGGPGALWRHAPPHGESHPQPVGPPRARGPTRARLPPRQLRALPPPRRGIFRHGLPL
jgi:hypothetical protein